MWMVRSASGGRLADVCHEKGVVAIGWSDVGDLSRFKGKQDLIAAIENQRPDWSPGKVGNSASQLIRFRDELQRGDRVITYDSSRRIYHVGRITGTYKHDADAVPTLPNIRAVDWEGEVDRDSLSVSTRNSLGSTLTLFKISEHAVTEIEAALSGKPAKKAQDEDIEEEGEEDLLEHFKQEAFEITKDRVNRLDWEQMQELVAGLLRAMGYKTRVAAPGPDRGVDVMASPDGFGFESPRIMVEVKHRSQSIGAQQIRSFLGGRHKDDKGLYVSTAGFSKEARYEADRANVPLTLMDIDDLVRAVLENYEAMDVEARNLLPLRKIYWPV